LTMTHCHIGRRQQTMTPLKSLAHPDWPYEGTPHEWRGFKASVVCPDCGTWVSRYDFCETCGKTKQEVASSHTYYQNLNFGPNLD
jgi:hypothetical protein